MEQNPPIEPENEDEYDSQDCIPAVVVTEEEVITENFNYQDTDLRVQPQYSPHVEDEQVDDEEIIVVDDEDVKKPIAVEVEKQQELNEEIVDVVVVEQEEKKNNDVVEDNEVIVVETEKANGGEEKKDDEFSSKKDDSIEEGEIAPEKEGENKEPEKLRKLFIGSLPYEANSATLADFYSQFGEIEGVFIARDPVTGTSKGYAFITFTTKASVDAVIRSRPHEISGRVVAEKRATPKTYGQAHDTNSLYVSGIYEGVTEEALSQYFSKYGEVEKVKIHIDAVTLRPRGFAFISFADSDSVDQCILDDTKHIVNGTFISAKKSMPKQQYRDRQNRAQRSRGDMRNARNVGGWGYGYRQAPPTWGGQLPMTNFYGMAAPPPLYTPAPFINTPGLPHLPLQNVVPPPPPPPTSSADNENRAAAGEDTMAPAMRSWFATLQEQNPGIFGNFF